MIETAVFSSRAWPTHSDALPLEEIEHEWRHSLSYGASTLDPLSLSTRLHEKEQYPTCVRDVIHPLFAPMAHQVKYGSRKGMGSEDVLHEKEQYPACVRNVAHPLFAPMAHLVKYGGQKGMGAEEVLCRSEEPSAAIHAKDDELKDLAIHDALVRLAFTLPSMEDFIYLVQKCREEKVLNHARQLHVHICYHGLEDYRVLGNYLVAMFVDCGNLFAAQQAFDKLVHRKEHSWTALIQGHIEGAKMQHALALYTRMQEDSVKPSKYTFLALLKACSKLKCLERGREIDYEISENRLKEDLFVGNALVDMYAKCGSLVEARQVLDKLPVQDVVSWNALITGYAEHGLGKDALRCLDEMQLKGVPPNSVTYLCSLKACGSIGAIDRGHKVNMEIVKLGFERDLFYGNSLLDMYGKCGLLAEARKVFDELNIRDVVSWTALISGYAEHAFGEEALTCLEQMELEGVPSNSVTFVCSLKACASIGAADKGQKLHSQIVKKGLEKSLCVGNTLLDMYAKCGLLFEAYLVFDTVSARDVVSWSALITGYMEHGLHEEALYSFEQMQLEGVAPNEFSWNAVILGVSDLARSEKAVNLYLQMQEKGLLPNNITFASVLKALGSSGDIEGGRRIHAQVKRVGLETTEIVLATALVDMYGRCGGMFEAKEIFDAICSRDLVAWSAMIMGYVRQGEIQSVFSTYEGMREECILPDEMTFLSILTMCSHAGLVDKGWAYFESLSKTSVSSLTIKHLNCMVDLLGRAGRLDEANLILQGMPFEPDLATCCTMLRACRMRGNTELGRQTFECAKRLDRMYQTIYVLMFNIYADAHMWEEAKEIEIMYAELQAKEVQGKSWVEINGLIHIFVDDETYSSQNSDICERLELITDQYMLARKCAVKETLEDGTACEHSESLAVVSGLLNTSMAPVRVAKNLRVCDDCHTFLGVVSRMEQRTIIYRDAARFHTFKDGVCSCSDYSTPMIQKTEPS